MDTNSMAILILLGSFALLILMRVQIAYAVGISSILCCLYLKLPITTICQMMVKGVNSFSLMAVPFFFFLAESQVPQRLTQHPLGPF